MDDQRFDNLTRLFGSGLNRRKVLRGLLGGAGALAVAGTSRQLAGAQADCDPNADTITCPPGSFHEGLTKKPGGECCNGNGNCCSNVCTDGFCVDEAPPECEDDGDCGTCQVCDGGECFSLICCDSECDPCSSCVNDQCVPYAEYCPESQQCYNTGTGECCYDNECGCGECVQGQCSVPECCNDDDCDDPVNRASMAQCVIEVCFTRVDCDECPAANLPGSLPCGKFPGQ